MREPAAMRLNNEERSVEELLNGTFGSLSCQEFFMSRETYVSLVT
jgi:hypothetical protein